MKLFCVLLLLAGFLNAQSDRTNLDQGFDKPLKKTVVDLGPSPYYSPSQHVRKELTCYYYSTFTVKQYDEGQKGAESLAIVQSGQAACTRTHGKGEKAYNWSGYFWGAKGMIAFFVAPDGDDGGLPFGAFDVKTGRKLFEDSALLDYYRKKLHVNSLFRVIDAAGQIPPLNYFRVVRAGCDLKTERANCWNKVRAKLGITQTRIPVCSGYETAKGRWESAVVYPVSVLLSDSPHIEAVDGPVFCWPTD